MRFAMSVELQAKVRAAVERSLDLWWQFFDGIEQTIDAVG